MNSFKVACLLALSLALATPAQQQVASTTATHAATKHYSHHPGKTHSGKHYKPAHSTL